MSEFDADVVVIGSGFGGSVAASRLVAAGKKVTLLERGPWRDTVATRYAGIEGAKPLPRDGGMFTVLRSLRPPKGPNRITLNRNGYLEKWIGDGIKVPVTSNVGGGSHIWAAILERPEGDYWDGRADGVSSEALAPHYDRMTQELRGTQPEDASNVPNHTDEAWKGAGFLTDLKPGEQPPMGILYGDGNSDVVTDENGITRKPIDMATDNGMFGSSDASKSTVDALFLLPAVQDGLDVRALHEVQNITRTDDGFFRRCP